MNKTRKLECMNADDRILRTKSAYRTEKNDILRQAKNIHQSKTRLEEIGFVDNIIRT